MKCKLNIWQKVNKFGTLTLYPSRHKTVHVTMVSVTEEPMLFADVEKDVGSHINSPLAGAARRAHASKGERWS